MAGVDIQVPDIGDFKDIPVIEVLVKPGDVVAKEQSLLTLESDKATMEIPSPSAGRIAEVLVKVGDKVSQGTPIARLDDSAGTGSTGSEPVVPTQPALERPGRGAGTQSQGTQAAAPAAVATPDPPTTPPKAAASEPSGSQPSGTGAELRAALSSTLASFDADLHAEVLVLGAGPGGYTAAFRAADLGKKVVLVERHATLGGVCLNVGCIPSKALLHAARVVADAEEMSAFGIEFGAPKVELAKLRTWKDGVVGKLTRGLAALAKARKVTVVRGTGRFATAHTLEVEGPEGRKVVSFDHCIVAAGSRSARIPGLPYDDPRLMDSTRALAIDEVPARLLVIGGGIIGLEMATVYHALGSKVSVVELMDRLIPGADP